MPDRKIFYCCNKNAINKGESPYNMFAIGENVSLDEVTVMAFKLRVTLLGDMIACDGKNCVIVGGLSLENLATVMRADGATKAALERAVEAGIIYFSPPKITDQDGSPMTKNYRALTKEEVEGLKELLP